MKRSNIVIWVEGHQVISLLTNHSNIGAMVLWFHESRFQEGSGNCMSPTSPSPYTDSMLWVFILPFADQHLVL